MIKVKKLYENSQFKRKRSKDLGYDCYAVVLDGLSTEFRYGDKYVIGPGKTASISLGIGVGFPDGYGGLLKERSGLAKESIHILGGVLDEDYIGELIAVVYNSGDYPLEIKTGDRICQLVLVVNIDEDVEFVDELEATERGEKGFGSSGR